MMRIGFLFNHDHVHQVAHSLPIALALARLLPAHRIVLAVTSEALAREVADIAGNALNAPNIDVHHLPLRSRTRRLAAKLLDPFLPAHRLLTYGDHVELLRSLDALVTSEKTSLALKSLAGFDRLKMIHTRHGAGDRAIGFDRASTRFDLVLASGFKIAQRLMSDAGVAADRIRIVGYPKFDLQPRSFPPFDKAEDGRPIVLYNPHVAPHLSSWYRAGRGILDWFASQSTYRLIFAPHVMLFRRRVVATIDPAGLGFSGHVPKHILAASHIHIDLGSAASTDMTYLEHADIYLGDASSQVYEFLRRPRPCLFFDAHHARWRGNANFLHWQAGRVVTSLDRFGDALARCSREHALRYRKVQSQLFKETFDLTTVPSADRAAVATAQFLGLSAQGDQPTMPSHMALVRPRRAANDADRGRSRRPDRARRDDSSSREEYPNEQG